MPEPLGTAVLKLTTDSSKLVSGLAVAKAAAKGMSKGFKKAAIAVGIAAGAALAHFTKESMKLSKEFETSMTKIIALVGIPEEQINIWSEQLLEAAPSLRKLPQELSDAMFFVTSAGLRGETAMEALKISAMASASELGDLEKIADVVTSAMNAYGKEVLSAEDATDVLVGTIREGKLDSGELAGVIGKVIPIASNMGVEFNEVGAAIAAMSKTGTNASEATTALTNILSTLLDPAESVKIAMGDIGTNAEEVRRQIREEGLLKALRNLKDLAKENEVEFAKFFPNIRGLSGAFDLLGTNLDDNIRIFESLNNVQGLTRQAFADTAETAEQKLASAMAGLQASTITFGDNLNVVAVPVQLFFINISKAIIDGINEIIEFFANFEENLKKMGEGVKIILENIVAWFVKLNDDVTMAIRNMIENIVAWFVILKDDVTMAIRNMIENIVAGFVILKDDPIEAIRIMTEIIVDYFVFLKADVLFVIQTMVEGIGDWFGDRFQNIVDGLGDIIGGIVDFFKGISEKIVGHSIVPDMVNDILGWFSYMRDESSNIIEDIAVKFENGWGGIAQTAINNTQILISSLQKSFSVYYDWRLSNENHTAEEIEKIMRRQAIVQKTFALISIAIDTATGVVRALSLGPVGIPIAVAIGALGAAQALAVGFTPIPTASATGAASATASATGAASATASATGAASATGGATFQQQRPIYVTIDVHDNQIYGGDLREFAILLRTELESVDALGL